MVAIAALALFNLWAGSYCYRHRGTTPAQQTSPSALRSGNVTLSEMWLAAR